MVTVTFARSICLLGGGSKRFAVGEESVVLLDSEEEEQPRER